MLLLFYSNEFGASSMIMIMQMIIWISWFIALFLLVLKIAIPSIDSFTSYGKLNSKPVYSTLFTRQFAFTSAYALGALWNLTLLGCYIYFYESIGEKLSVIFILCILYQVHLLRRVYESIQVHIYSKEPMHIVNILLMWAYYFFAPLALHFDLILSHNDATPLVMLCCGIGLFFIGNAVQAHSHVLLRRLREKNKSEKRYFIPEGGLFNYVSSPHYFGELILYLGLLLISNVSEVGPIILFTFVAVTMISQSVKVHKWYNYKFKEEYPLERKAIIPYVL